MESYDPTELLDAIDDERVLPHPVLLRDVMARASLSPAHSVELQRYFHDYLRHYGDAESVAREMLSLLAKTRK
ncbi:MAG: hypothetical protein KIT83_07670 [Bryobacterales bacterium]|nr:hypothetical protein [Bryobacterales bacterium]